MHACMHLLLYEKEKLAPERMALCVCRVLWLQVRHMHDMHHFENSFCRLWPRAHPKRMGCAGVYRYRSRALPGDTEVTNI